MDDVGEHGAIELVYLNSDGVRAVVGYRIKKITKPCAAPRRVRRWRREVVSVAADVYGSALADRDDCEGESDGRSEWRSCRAIAHATEVRGYPRHCTMHSRYGLDVTVDGRVYNFRTEDSRICFDRSSGVPRLDRVLLLRVKGVKHRPWIGDESS